MRIAYLVNRYPAVSHSFIRREILGLEAAGHEVLRFTLRAPEADLPDPADRAEAARTTVVLAQPRRALLAAALGRAVRRPGRFLAALRTAVAMGQGAPARVARQLAYLVEACWLAGRIGGATHLHAHFGTNPAAVARLLHRLTGLRYSFTVHGPEEFDGPLALDLPGKIADAHAAVAISSYGRSQLMRWTPVERWGRLRIVRCGVDRGFAAAPVPPPAAAPALVCVARLSGQKGLPLLVEAAALLRARGIAFHLTLIGDGELRGEVERLIAARGLDDAVAVTGYLDAAAIRARLAAARAMVLPSFAEGLPVVLMEALALAVPVVTTFVAGIPELVDEQCGWLVPAGSPERLADAMAAALAADPARLRAMGEAGRARVLAAHDADANAHALAAIFAEP